MIRDAYYVLKSIIYPHHTSQNRNKSHLIPYNPYNPPAFQEQKREKTNNATVIPQPLSTPFVSPK